MEKGWRSHKLNGADKTRLATVPLSHIKKSVLDPEAFDRFISAWIPEGSGRSCFHPAPLFRSKRSRRTRRRGSRAKSGA